MQINLCLKVGLISLLIIGFLSIIINKVWTQRCRTSILIEGESISSQLDQKKKGEWIKVKLINVNQEGLLYSDNCFYSRDIKKELINQQIRKSSKAIISNGEEDVSLSNISILEEKDRDTLELVGQLMKDTKLDKIENKREDDNCQIIISV
jgi:hypothetical protein